MTSKFSFRIYISSTVDDLKPQREIARSIASEYGEVKMTSGAHSEPVVDVCLADVRSSDVYVGIVSWRYGWTPGTSVNPKRKSITELEYDECGETVPRLVFVNKGPILPQLPFQDDDTTRIKAFRERVQQGHRHTAVPFNDADPDVRNGFAYRLNEALRVEKLRQSMSPQRGGAFGGTGRPRTDLLQALALVGVAGDDDVAIATLKGVDESNASCTTLRLDDVDWWTELDRRLRVAQSPCLLLTNAGLSRLKSDPDVVRIAEVLRDGRACTRPVTLVLAGVDPADIPAAWSDGVPVCVAAPPSTLPAARALLDSLSRAIDARMPALVPSGQAEIDALHRQWHALASRRSALAKVALPVVIVAPTASEIESLVDPARPGFAGYEKALKRRQRVDDFKRLQPDRKRREAGWPGDTYRADRALWRCFGPEGPSAMAIVLAAVKAINDAAVGTRERRMLPRLSVVPRLYRFDDLLDGGPGPAAVLLDAAASGALVIVDEFALLHPRLREAIRPLLDLPRTAAVSISGSDPMHSKTAVLLDEDSFLHVGQFMHRYQIERDPRCEVAVNNVQRLERWIRMVVPEMLALGDAGEALPELAPKATELFTPTIGLI